MYGVTLDFNVSVSNGNLNTRSENQFFPLKLFLATVANANTECLKSLHTLFDMYLEYLLAKFEPNRIVQNVQEINFWTKKKTKKQTKKTRSFETILTKG